jgi:uncharacterized membrane protein HdeD (DUF308 family)
MKKRNSQDYALLIEKIPIISVILTVIGLLLICFPESATAAVLRASGIIILIYSIYRLVFVFLLDKDIFRTTFDFALAFAALIVSILLLADPMGMSMFISMLFGLYLITDGAFRLWRLAISKARYEYYGMPIDKKSRAIKTALSTVTLVVGAFLLIFPLATHKFAAIITGVCLVFEGIKGIIARIIEWKKSPNKSIGQKPMDIEADFEDKTNE